MSWKLLLTGISIGIGVGCPGGNTNQGPVDECTQIGQQCQLKEGVIGVCSPTQEDNCNDPPCLMCTPQH